MNKEMTNMFKLINTIFKECFLEKSKCYIMEIKEATFPHYFCMGLLKVLSYELNKVQLILYINLIDLKK